MAKVGDGKLRGLPLEGLQVSVNSQTRNDGVSFGHPTSKKIQDSPPGRLQLAGNILEGAEFLALPSPLPRLRTVFVVCSQVKAFSGARSFSGGALTA